MWALNGVVSGDEAMEIDYSGKPESGTLDHDFDCPGKSGMFCESFMEHYRLLNVQLGNDVVRLVSLKDPWWRAG